MIDFQFRQVALFVFVWILSGTDLVPSRSEFGFKTDLKYFHQFLSELFGDSADIFDEMFDFEDVSFSQSPEQVVVKFPAIKKDFLMSFISFGYLRKHLASKVNGVQQRFNLYHNVNGQISSGEQNIINVRRLQMRHNQQIGRQLCPSAHGCSVIHQLMQYQFSYWLKAWYDRHGALPYLPPCIIVANRANDDEQVEIEREQFTPHIRISATMHISETGLHTSSCGSRLGSKTKTVQHKDICDPPSKYGCDGDCSILCKPCNGIICRRTNPSTTV